MDKPPYRMVVVSWRDAYSRSAWTPAPATLGPMPCLTVGFLVEDEKEYITVAQSWSTDDGIGDRTSIPRGCITSVKTLIVKSRK